MSAYGNYIWETRGMRIIEGIHGFATYLIDKEECYVEDVYIEVDQRKCGAATQMVDKIATIARDAKCTYLTTTVNGRFKDPDTSLKSCLSYGFKIHKILNDVIFLKMEI